MNRIIATLILSLFIVNVSADEIPAVLDESQPGMPFKIGDSTYDWVLCGWENGEPGHPLVCGRGAVINEVFVGTVNEHLSALLNAQQKPADSIPVAQETAQEIITAYEAQENARLAYVAAQSKTDAIVNKAKAQAKCWPCSLNRNAQGQLVLIPDLPSKETPKP